MIIVLVVVSCGVRVVVVGLTCGLQAGNTALLVACENGQLAVARWLIEEKDMDYRAEKNNVSGSLFLVGVAFLVTIALVVVSCDVRVVVVVFLVPCRTGTRHCWLRGGMGSWRWHGG